MAIISRNQSSINYLFMMNKDILKKNWALNYLQLLDLAPRRGEEMIWAQPNYKGQLIEPHCMTKNLHFDEQK